MSIKNLERIFNPESVAVLGVSRKEGSVGYTLFKNLVSGGFKGRIYGINPHVSELFGKRIYRSLAEVEDSVDLAIVAVPAEVIPSVLRECIKKGVKGAVVVSSEIKEHEGLDREVFSEAQNAGIRIIGPNCLGFVITSLGLNVSFSSSLPPAGNMAFISQSGALCTAIMDWACKERVGLSHVISVGEMLDVDFGDLIDYLGNDSCVKSILLYVESLTNIKRFVGAARSVSRIKPIIALRAGKGEVGGYGKLFYTESLITEDDVYNTLFKRTGIVKVDTIHELFNTAESLSKQPRPLNPNLVIITNVDGIGFMASHLLSTRWGVELPKLKQETVRKLDDILPPYANKQNPVCIFGDIIPEQYVKTIEVCMEDEEVGGIITIFAPHSITHPSDVARAISDTAKRLTTKPIFAVWMGGQLVADALSILNNESSIPTFGTPEEAVNAFMHMYFYSYNLKLIQETPKLIEGKFDKKRVESIIESFLRDKSPAILPEVDSKAVVASYEIPVNSTEVVTTPMEASKVARDLGFPVVLKVHSPDLTDRSSVGAVAFTLHTDSEVVHAFERILSNVKKLRPDASVLGVTVQPMMMEKGFELILGAHKDPVFGPLILFGTGGSMAEFIRDIAIAIPPINSTLALRLMEKTRIFNLLLRGFRDIPPANVDSLVKIVVNFSELITDFPEIVDVDLNPLYVRGDSIVVLDARIRVERTKDRSPHHLIIAPYPDQYESYHTLKDGTVVLLRPIRPEDEPLILELFNTFSEKTIVYRFFRLIRVTTHEQLVRFTQIDYERELSIIAVSQPPGRQRILGIVQLVFEPVGNRAEFALVVGDPWQGRGLGRKLMEVCISIAKERKVKLLWGEIIPENIPMINLCKKMGFNIEKKNGSVYAELRLE
ncbi:hypothetical protein HRbin37_01643 [bacterium HR37]|nr:hypothetical protein HRbin37_01643 [bacterium HR37]